MISSTAPPALSLTVAGVLVAVLVPATVIDLRERRIPNRITGPAALVAVAIGLALDPSGQPVRCAAAVAVVVALLLVRAPRPAAFGLGDVKLAGVLGLCLGPTVAVAVGCAFAAGSVAAIGVVARRGRRALRGATIPFGPYLAFGAAIAFVAGEPLLAGYLRLLG